MRNFAVLIFLLTILIGCANESAVKLQAGASKADIIFTRGKEYFDSGKWRKAIDVLSEYVYSYPYHDDIAGGTFMLAESYFKSEQFDLAAGEYRRIAQRFEDSEFAERAEIMIGESFLAASPRTDLEQRKTETALEYFRDFITYHPTSEFIDQAEDGINRCREKLAKKEFDTAKIYFKLKQPESVVLYADLIAEEYNGTSFVPEAMLLKGRAYSEMLELVDSAVKVFEEIIRDYPNTETAEEAAELLHKIGE